MIKMTIEEFKEKVKELGTIEIIEDRNFFRWHFAQVEGQKWLDKEQNQDFKKYIKNTFNNELVLTDAYHVKDERWIPKIHLDNLIKVLIEAKTYEEILEILEDNTWIKRGEIERKRKGIETKLKIVFNGNNGYLDVANYVIDKICNIEGEVTVEDFSYEDYNWLGWVEISKESINEKERCKHRCQTDKKIAEFDELFRK